MEQYTERKNYDAVEATVAIIEYCKKEIWNFEAYADLAVSKSWRENIPIECADYALANAIIEKIDEWQADHDTDFDITVDDIVLNM